MDAHNDGRLSRSHMNKANVLIQCYVFLTIIDIDQVCIHKIIISCMLHTLLTKFSVMYMYFTTVILRSFGKLFGLFDPVVSNIAQACRVLMLHSH